ncbi:MAG: alpha/beta fold hydrolase [Dehalococcoidia bacterium]|nr:alpha/beta fold hydrolase [Dehalococcoidia bacterium]
MPRVQNGDVSIYYETQGSGPPILLGHGYASSNKMWEPQLAPFSSKYRLITWEMRGHARSDSPADPDEYSAEKTIQDMKLVLEAEGVDRAIVVGFSLTGYFAASFYIAHPEMVTALVLFGTGPGYRNPVGREGWNKYAIARANELDRRGLESLPPDSTEVHIGLDLQKSPAGLAHAGRGMLTQSDDRVMKALPSIGVPTLVIVGDRDEPFLVASDYMAAKIPDSRLVVIKDAGHPANLHQPGAFNDAVLSFLDEVSAG